MVWDHSEHRNEPSDECDNDNSHHDRHTSTTYSRKDLTSDNAADDSVSNHEYDVEDSREL